MLRSFLFVPADNDKLLESALGKPSDVVILDLEDGTHPLKKAAAREKLLSSLKKLKSAGKKTAVRINSDLLTAVIDIEAAVHPELDILVLPKVEHPRDVQLLETAVKSLERRSSLNDRHVQFLIQIETVAALPKIYEIAAASERIMGMMIGSEDFSLDCGASPTSDALFLPSMMLLYAAKAAGVQPIGFIGSIAMLGDVSEFVPQLQRAKSLGFKGAVVVHPKFLDAVNECYTPTLEEVNKAKAVVQAFEQAYKQGHGAIGVDGLMVDAPVYQRVLRMLQDDSLIEN